MLCISSCGVLNEGGKEGKGSPGRGKKPPSKNRNILEGFSKKPVIRGKKPLELPDFLQLPSCVAKREVNLNQRQGSKERRKKEERKGQAKAVEVVHILQRKIGRGLNGMWDRDDLGAVK